MKIGIMQPYFIPYIGYWQLLNAVDKYIIYDDVNFIKGGWINRNRILLNGEAKYFNIQMQGASPNKLINEIEVSNNTNLINKNLRIIEAAYSKAPFFKEIFPIIEKILCFEEKNLALYVKNSIEILCDFLSINTELILSSGILKNNELKSQDKVIDICNSLGGKEYYNAVGGQDLYSFDAFEKNGMKLKFLKTNKIIYNQFSNVFVENLSIIDVMMFNPRDEILNMLNNYSLIEV